MLPDYKVSIGSINIEPLQNVAYMLLEPIALLFHLLLLGRFHDKVIQEGVQIVEAFLGLSFHKENHPFCEQSKYFNISALDPQEVGSTDLMVRRVVV